MAAISSLQIGGVTYDIYAKSAEQAPVGSHELSSHSHFSTYFNGTSANSALTSKSALSAGSAAKAVSASGANSASFALSSDTARNGNFYEDAVGIPANFNAASTYAVGDQVSTAGYVYSASAAVGTAGAWTAVSSKFAKLTQVNWTITDTSITGLYKGLQLWVKLPSYGGSSGSNATMLNINGTGAKQVRINNGNYTTHYSSGTVIHLTYDGTYFQVGDRTDGNDRVGQYSATDSQNYPIILKRTTGGQETQTVKYASAFTYNPSTSSLKVSNISSNNITATTFSGNLSGKATNLDVLTNNQDVWLNVALYSAGSDKFYIDSDYQIRYNPNKNILSATTFTGNLSGSATSALTSKSALSAGTAEKVQMQAKSDNTWYQSLFASTSTSSIWYDSDAKVQYNPSSNTFSATNLYGTTVSGATISGTNITAATTVRGTNISGTNISGATKTATIDNLITSASRSIPTVNDKEIKITTGASPATGSFTTNQSTTGQIVLGSMALKASGDFALTGGTYTAANQLSARSAVSAGSASNSLKLSGTDGSAVIGSAQSGYKALTALSALSGIKSFNTINASSGTGTVTAITAGSSGASWNLKVAGVMSITADTATNTITLSSRDNNSTAYIPSGQKISGIYGSTTGQYFLSALKLNAGDNITFTSASNSQITINATQPTVGNGTITINTGSTTATGTFTTNQNTNTTITLGSMALTQTGTYFSGTSALSALTAKSAQSAGIATKTQITDHTANDTDYAPIWTNPTNSSLYTTSSKYKFNPAAGRLYVSNIVKVGGCSMTWNASTSALDFNF